MSQLPWLLEQLQNVASEAGIEVSFVDLPTDGGLCKVRGRQKIIVSAAAPLAHQVDVLVDALKSVDLSEVFLLPKVREALEGPA